MKNEILGVVTNNTVALGKVSILEFSKFSSKNEALVFILLSFSEDKNEIIYV